MFKILMFEPSTVGSMGRRWYGTYQVHCITVEARNFRNPLLKSIGGKKKNKLRNYTRVIL